MSEYTTRYRGHSLGGGKARKAGGPSEKKKQRKMIYTTKQELVTTHVDGSPWKTFNQLDYQNMSTRRWAALFAQGKATRMATNGSWYHIGGAS